MSLKSDARHTLRRLAKSPGFTLNAIMMLALGIAISTLMAGVLRGLLGSLPFPDGDGLLVVNTDNARQQIVDGGMTPLEALRLDEDSAPFSTFGYFNWGGLTFYANQRARKVTIAQVSQGFFPTLGMPAQLGRWFSAEEFASESGSVVLSYDEWQRQFGGADDVIGQSVESSAGRLRVIGVMPATFAMPSSTVGAWRPSLRSSFPLDQPWTWNARFLNGLARLPAGVSAAQASQQLIAASDALALSVSMPQGEWTMGVRPMLDTIIGDLRGALWGAMSIALLVLLIGCANVAILIDARQISWRHEQALVQALGATRQRVLRGQLLELAVISTAAALLGVLLASFGIEALRELARGSLPRVDAIALDPYALIFAIALALLLPLLAAIAGALRLRATPADAMRGGVGKGMVNGGGNSLRWLPTLGIALSTVSLIAGSALLISLLRLAQVEPGFRSEGVYVMQLFRDGDEDEWRSFASALSKRLAAIPGVTHVALTSAAPLTVIGSFTSDILLRGRDEPEAYQIGIRRVDAGYLDLLDIPIIEGRGISADDRAGGEQVAVINQELARRLFGSTSPLDQIVMLPLGSGDREPYRVVGVSADIRNNGLRVRPGPELLIPFAVSPISGVSFLLRTDTQLDGLDMAAMDKQLEQALFDVDPREALSRSFSLSEEVDAQLASARFFARTVGGFALAALMLAALGVYAVAALQQRRRVAEFGLRLAIGARPLTLALEILRDSGRTVAFGVILGLLAAWATLRLLSAQLFGVGSTSPSVMLVGVGTLAIAAMLAALLPALRAARTDPMAALRDR